MSLYKGTNLIAGNPNSANPDLSNITNTAKTAIVHNMTPSTVYQQLTIGAVGSTYTAPADGYFRLLGASNTSAYARLTNNTTLMWLQDQINNAYGNLSILFPIAKGETVTLQYGGTTSLTLQFFYANGTAWEA
jgi:hypothetical protein